MNGMTYPIILENQTVLQLLKEMCLALLRITRTFIFLLVYIFLICLLVGASLVWRIGAFGCLLLHNFFCLFLFVEVVLVYFISLFACYAVE